MSILTLAQYKTLTNTTDATYDAFITAVLPAVQEQIENYCDRHFDATNYYKWFEFDRYLVLPEWPLNNVLFIGASDLVATVSITGTYTVEVFDTKICVTNEALTTTTFLYTAYANVTLLFAAITAAFAGIVFTIQSGYATCPPQRLRSGVISDSVYGAKQMVCGYRKSDLSNRILELAYDASYDLTYNLGEQYSDVIYVAWNGGYASADMPVGLQLIEANIIKDMILNMTSGVGGVALNPFITSETLTNYSYTVGNLAFVIQYLRKEFIRYYDALESYRKKEI